MMLCKSAVILVIAAVMAMAGCNTGSDPVASKPIDPCLDDVHLVIQGPTGNDEFVCGQKIFISWYAIDPCDRTLVADVDAYFNGKHCVVARGTTDRSVPWTCPMELCDEICFRVTVTNAGGNANHEVVAGPIRDLDYPGSRVPQELD